MVYLPLLLAPERHATASLPSLQRRGIDWLNNLAEMDCGTSGFLVTTTSKCILAKLIWDSKETFTSSKTAVVYLTICCHG
jgi:hypothetical protein